MPLRFPHKAHTVLIAMEEGRLPKCSAASEKDTQKWLIINNDLTQISHWSHMEASARASVPTVKLEK